MKTIRTIIATLSAVLLTFALVAWFSVRRNAAFIQRTIYQGFEQTFVVALVMGCAFLLIAVILTVAIVSTDSDDEDEMEERVPYRPRYRQEPPRRSAAERGEQPYRRVSRDWMAEPVRSPRREESGSGRSQADAPKPKKRDRAVERPDEITLRREEAPVKREKKAPRPAPVAEPEEAPEAAPAAAPVAAPKPDAPVPKPEMNTEAAAELAVSPAEEDLPEAAELPEEEVPAAPETAEEAPDEEEIEEAPAAEPHPDENTVRCVFCGSIISREDLFCPRCGKKR